MDSNGGKESIIMNDEAILDRITSQALRLPPVQKAQLVERLMATLQHELAEPRPEPAVPEQRDQVQPPATEALFKQRLLEAGLLTEIKTPRRRPTKRSPPLRVAGKPLSEIVIEDRR